MYQCDNWNAVLLVYEALAAVRQSMWAEQERKMEQSGGLPKTWRDRRDRRDSENGQYACPVCVWQTGQADGCWQTWRDRWDAEEKNQKCIRLINKIRKLQKCS